MLGKENLQENFKAIKLQLNINPEPLKFIIDTGSTVSIIKESKITNDIEISSSMKLKISGLTQEKVTTLGMIVAIYKQARKFHYLKFEVIKDSDFTIKDCDGIIGLNNLKSSEISLLKNQIVLNENEPPLQMNVDSTNTYKPKRFQIENKKEPRISKLPVVDEEFCLFTQLNQMRKIDDVNERFEILRKTIKIKTTNEISLKRINEIIYKYNHAFFIDGDEFQATDRAIHSIKLKSDAKPAYVRQFKIKESLMDELTRQVNQLERDGIVERCFHSLWNSPIFLVKKKEKDDFRLVVDLRELNERILTNFQELPSIETILFNLKGMKVFSVIDVKNAYYTIPLDEESKDLTAFTLGHRKYRFTRNLMGLKSAGFVFVEMMANVLEELNNKILFQYVDDLIIFAESEEQCLINIERTLEVLSEANIKISPKKSTFLADRIEFLGHIISAEGVEPNEEKVQTIRNFPIPDTPKKVRAFLGMANYYRRYFPEFAELANPLIELTKKKTKFLWTQECYNSFNSLKECLAKTVLLNYIDPKKSFIVTTDASKFSIAGVLSQLDENDQERPISFCSKKLTKVESATSSLERELIAICYCVCNAFRTFLCTNQFVVKTDNRALVYILNSQLEHSNDRIIRLRLKLLSFDFKVLFQKGSNPAHITADLLSRTEYIEDTNDDEKEEKMFIVTRAMKVKSDEKYEEEFKDFVKILDTTKTPTNIKESMHEIDLTEKTKTKLILFVIDQLSFPENIKERILKIIKRNSNINVGDIINEDNINFMPFKTKMSKVTSLQTLFMILSKFREKNICQKSA